MLSFGAFKYNSSIEFQSKKLKMQGGAFSDFLDIVLKKGYIKKNVISISESLYAPIS